MSSSIGANIAEGYGGNSNGEFGRFLQIAMGSASVLEDHILLAKDLKLLNNEKYHSLKDKVIEIKKMLSTLISKLIADCYYAPL